jgi:hypothetical protein
MSDEKSLREVAERVVHWLRNSTYLQYTQASAAGQGALKIDDKLVWVIDANGRIVRRERRFPRLSRLWGWLSS